MKIKISKQFKAALLIIIFSMNTVIGFACAVGIDMEFNSTHHDDEEVTETVMHEHSDGKKHNNQQQANHHDEQNNDQPASKENKDNCCNDKVIKFIEVDKSASHSLSGSISPVFFTTFLTSFYDTNIFYTSYVDTRIKYFVRSHHPPIPDIRIAIRSFQI